MQLPVLTSQNGVTLAGGGDLTSSTLSEALTYAPELAAADGAAGVVWGFGHIPRAVIGDFDSIDAHTRASLAQETLHYVGEQDSTDFEKCLTRIVAPFMLAVGFMGKQPDHEMAVYNALVRLTGLARPLWWWARRTSVCMLMVRLRLIFLWGRAFRSFRFHR